MGGREAETLQGLFRAGPGPLPRALPILQRGGAGVSRLLEHLRRRPGARRRSSGKCGHQVGLQPSARKVVDESRVENGTCSVYHRNRPLSVTDELSLWKMFRLGNGGWSGTGGDACPPFRNCHPERVGPSACGRSGESKDPYWLHDLHCSRTELFQTRPGRYDARTASCGLAHRGPSTPRLLREAKQTLRSEFVTFFNSG
jgi:hypothetical protein